MKGYGCVNTDAAGCVEFLAKFTNPESVYVGWENDQGELALTRADEPPPLTGRFPLYATWFNRSDDRPSSERAWDDRNGRPKYKPAGFVPKWLKDIDPDVPEFQVGPAPEDCEPEPKVKFFWWPTEKHPGGLEVEVDDHRLVEGLLTEGRPFGYRVDQGEKALAFHSDEVYELDQRNIGCDIAAQKLLEVAQGDTNRNFGGAKMRAAAEAIAGLHARIAALECEVARLKATARPF